jgi:hypothetical protein
MFYVKLGERHENLRGEPLTFFLLNGLKDVRISHFLTFAWTCKKEKKIEIYFI